VEMALEKIDWPRDDPRWFRCATKPLNFWHHIPWLYAGNREFDRRTYLACFRLILERCAPNVTGGFARTILHEVAAMGTHVTNEEVGAFGRAALDAGAVIKVRDDILKSTSLGWACRWGRPQLVGLMLERGADPVEADAEPWAMPRAWATKMGHNDVLRVLAQYGGRSVTVLSVRSIAPRFQWKPRREPTAWDRGCRSLRHRRRGTPGDGEPMARARLSHRLYRIRAKTARRARA